MSENRKRFVIDTSVLLYDKKSIHSFPGNDVILPLQVIDEIDKFKERPGVVGEAARYVNRFLDEMRKYGRLDEGANVPDEYSSDQTIRIKIDEPTSCLPAGLKADRPDNKILAACVSEVSKGGQQPLIVVTKDINLRVKCDALGIPSEDYWKDHLEDDSANYSGSKEVAISQKEMDSFFENGFLEVEDDSILPNQFVVLKSESGSGLAIHRNCRLEALKHKPGDAMSNFVSKNKEQKFAVEALLRTDIELVTLTGLAGSGKTYVALMAGLDGLQEGRYSRIVISRSIQPVGRDLGYLPGDVDEKMAPWLAPIMDNFRTMMGDKDFTYFHIMMDKGELEVAPLSFIRGRTFNDSYVIVDEAQNATIHELKTIITRVGKNSKVVLLGDTDQIDTPYIDRLSNGLSIVIHKFKDRIEAAHVSLNKGQRSNIATVASSIL
ncbi:MAG: phosphate starvation-inducible protein PhoH [Legionellales bacterium]|mgnify:CR=1 FL=1|nr:phosphate starvation-inducible protein PhoH [Legionellales bacterium]